MGSRSKGAASFSFRSGITHDFRNTTDEDAGLLNFFTPGGFERKMPAIVKWFAENR